MLFNYKVVTKEGQEKKGQIEAASSEIAVATLQRREYVVVSVVPDKQGGLFGGDIPFLGGVKMKDIVLMSKQASTLFEAQVSAVKTFELLGQNSESRGIQAAVG